MAIFGVLATYISQLKNLKSCQKTYFSANIRLTNRRFVVNVCYHYIVSAKSYVECLGVIRHGRQLSEYCYNLYQRKKLHTNLNFFTLNCVLGRHYPRLQLINDGGLYLTYYEDIMTTYMITWEVRLIGITKEIEGKPEKKIKSIRVSEREFGDCLEAVNYMLKKANYFKQIPIL